MLNNDIYVVNIYNKYFSEDSQRYRTLLMDLVF